MRLIGENYQDSLLEFLVSALYARMGETGTLRGERKTSRFEIKKALGGGECTAAAELTFSTPKGRTLTHSVDILLAPKQGAQVVIDLKWAEADLDSIKARAFDMLLLKQRPGKKLWSVMIYLRPAGGGVSGDQARDICFPYDEVFAIEHQDPQNPAAWVPILDLIGKMIEK